jgi:glycosyltransferase involved in cell wall biosynthesis
MRSVTVSIGMPVFNGADYIRDALEALLAQSYSDFEIIISDNASTDKTEAICREFALRDGRVRYVRNPENIGAAGNYNNVVKLARGEFFKWASHDDLCHPRFLEACVNGFKCAPDDVVLVYPRAEFIDPNGIVIEDDLDTLEVSAVRSFVPGDKPFEHGECCIWPLSIKCACTDPPNRFLRGF